MTKTTFLVPLLVGALTLAGVLWAGNPPAPQGENAPANEGADRPQQAESMAELTEKKASEPTPAEQDRAALELGRRVLAVGQAIQNPRSPGAMQAVTDLGHDQRHYVMVRGWLTYQMLADQSLIEAHHGNAPEQVTQRVEFLRRAIRAVDLD